LSINAHRQLTRIFIASTISGFLPASRRHHHSALRDILHRSLQRIRTETEKQKLRWQIEAEILCVYSVKSAKSSDEVTMSDHYFNNRSTEKLFTSAERGIIPTENKMHYRLSV